MRTDHKPIPSVLPSGSVPSFLASQDARQRARYHAQRFAQLRVNRGTERERKRDKQRRKEARESESIQPNGAGEFLPLHGCGGSFHAARIETLSVRAVSERKLLALADALSPILLADKRAKARERMRKLRHARKLGTIDPRALK